MTETTFATDAIKQEAWSTDRLKKDAVKLEQKIYRQEMKQKKILAAEEEGVATIAQFRKAIETIEETEDSTLKSCFLRELAREMIDAIASDQLQGKRILNKFDFFQRKCLVLNLKRSCI